MGIIRRKIRISGRVQGVGFRYATRQQAQKIGGLSGFVRNEAEGTVYIEVTGPEKDVDDLVAWCYRGSTMSDVEKVEIIETENDADAPGSDAEFVIEDYK